MSHSIRRVTWRLRLRPSFLIIGTQKGGTTSLFRYLQGHPRLRLPRVKEMHYFDLQYARGLRWYLSRFPLSSGGDSKTGEATPYYLFHPDAPERAWETLSDARLLVLLREPTQRAYSHYQHELRAGRESLSFREALDAEPERLAKGGAQHFSYATRGLYGEQLERWWRYFPREQTLVLDSAELFRDPAAALRRVTRFLELESWTPPRFERHNAGHYRGADPGDLRRLRAFYREPNQRLFSLLGEEFDW